MGTRWEVVAMLRATPGDRRTQTRVNTHEHADICPYVGANVFTCMLTYTNTHVRVPRVCAHM